VVGILRLARSSGGLIEDIGFDSKKLHWELTKDGYTIQNAYLPSFDKQSTYLEAIGKTINIEFKTGSLPETVSGNIFKKSPEDFFLSIPVFIPKALQGQKGTIKLTSHDPYKGTVSTTKDFSHCDPEGRLFLTLSLGKPKNVKKLSETLNLQLTINTKNPHTIDMMPFVIEPTRIVRRLFHPLPEGEPAKRSFE